MAEFEKDKAGLQKNVSSVFKGVPVPRESAGQRVSGTPGSDQAPGAASKPASAGQQPPESPLMRRLREAGQSPGNAAPERTAEAKARPVSADRAAPQRPAANKLHEPQSAPKETAPAKQPKADPLAEAANPSVWQKINHRLFAPKPGVNPVRQKAMVILVPILAIVMIFVFRQVLGKAPRQTQGAVQEPASVVAAASSKDEIDWQIPEPLPAAMRDPIQLPDQNDTGSNVQNGASGTKATTVMDVRDIVFSKDKPSAVINGQIVYVGHKVGDATVVRIDRDGVELEKDGNKWIEKVHD